MAYSVDFERLESVENEFPRNLKGMTAYLERRCELKQSSVVHMTKEERHLYRALCKRELASKIGGLQKQGRSSYQRLRKLQLQIEIIDLFLHRNQANIRELLAHLDDPFLE